VNVACLSFLPEPVVMDIDVTKLRDELAYVLFHKTKRLCVVTLDLDKVTWLKLNASEEASPPIRLLGGF
jgi:hypothetical protein